MRSYSDIFRLRDNPFATTPPGVERPIVWAGRTSLKQELVEMIKNSFITSPSRIIINWGEWGAGKTHAMKYFSQKENLEVIAKEVGAKTGFSIPVVCPKRNVLESLYLSIIESIGFGNLKEVILKIVFGKEKIVDKKEQLRRLENVGFNYAIAKALQALLSKDSRIRNTAERYLYLEATRSDLKILGAPRRIRLATDLLSTLAQIFRLLGSEQSLYSRVFLWIDEMETIENLSGKELTDLRSFLRSIVDMAPQRLTVFLNATWKAAELESFHSYLGPAVLERVYTRISFPEMEEQDTISYVNELVNSHVYRTSEHRAELEKKELSLFPFGKDGILTTHRLLTKHLKREPTPRNINDALSGAMDLAIRDEKLVAELKALNKVIDKSFIKEKWNAIKIGIHVFPVM